MLIPLRRELRHYPCLRPVRLLKGITSPLANRTPDEIDFLVVRENNEGEYSKFGGTIYEGTDDEVVTRISAFTRRGVDRILRFAFEQASKETLDVGHQVQWHLLLDAVLGRARRGARGGVTGR